MSIDGPQLRQLVLDHVVPIGLRILLVLALFAFGRAVARAVVRWIDRVLELHAADRSLRRFIGDVAYVAMLGALAVVALDTLGVKTTAVVAVLGAAGLAIGLALQGSLANFAAGVLIILLRPYRLGDLVILGKYAGRVEVIKVFHTIVITADHRQIVLPNGQVLQQPIENLTALGRRRVDVVVTVSQIDDLEALKTRLVGAAREDPRIASSPPPTIDVVEFNEAGARLCLHAWTSAEAHAEVGTAELERMRAALVGSCPKFTVALGAQSLPS